MSRARFVAFVVLLLGTHCWGVRPNRFRTILDSEKKQEDRGTAKLLEQERVREIAQGYDFTGVTSKDQNPYVGLYRNILADVGKALTENGIVWHITFGTLIGHQRVGKFLPYDSDLDIYVVGKPFEDKAKFAAMQASINNLNKGYTFSSVGGPVYRVQKNMIPGMGKDARGRGPTGEGSWVDLYHYGACNSETAADRLCDGFEVPKGVKLQMLQILPPVDCVLDNISCKCPKNPTYLLDAYYDSWRTPSMQYCDGMWKAKCSQQIALQKPAETAAAAAVAAAAAASLSPAKPAPARTPPPAAPNAIVPVQAIKPAAPAAPALPTQQAQVPQIIIKKPPAVAAPPPPATGANANTAPKDVKQLTSGGQNDPYNSLKAIDLALQNEEKLLQRQSRQHARKEDETNIQKSGIQTLLEPQRKFL